MTIHKEGRKMLFILLLMLFGANMLAAKYFPENQGLINIIIGASVIAFLVVLQFFRNPKIAITCDEKCVLAPADGKVVVIEDAVETEYFKEKRKQISIFMSPVNVHVNRNPVSGLVKYFKYHSGDYKVAWHPKSSTHNERTTLVVETEGGLEILVRQIAGAVARRIKCYVDEGDKILQGNEFGFIKFGSRVDVFLPIDSKIKVALNQKTKGGRTILAELP